MYGGFFGDPVGIRTLDLLIRSQSLYPAELPSHDEEYSRNGTSTPPFLAGAEGIEPSSAVLETDVLPLYDAPKIKSDAYGIRTRECRRERAVC